MSTTDHPDCILGLDLGTTSVKCVVIDRQTSQVLAKQSKDTQAGEGGQQDVTKIITAFQNCVGRLPRELLRNVSKIGVCGQMHGIVMWKQEGCWTTVSHAGTERFEVSKGNISPLFTWQDSTCSAEFLSSLPPPDSHLRIAAGYGCATLFWKQANEPELLEQYDQAATVQDFVVALLCDLKKPIMSIQNAASWGYFNLGTNQWNEGILMDANFPIRFLPEVVKPGEVAGRLSKNWYGIPEGVQVLAALGDMQCSVLSTLFSESESTAVLNVSTSAQLSLIMPPDFHPARTNGSQEALEYFPYFQGRYLAVAASLNGGNVMASFIRMLQSWLGDLGCGIPQAHIWERVVTLAQQATPLDGPSDQEAQMVIQTTLFGERHLPGPATASVANITASNISLGQVACSVYAGLVANLHRMFSCETLKSFGATGMVGTGSALSRNPGLQHQVALQYEGLAFRMVQQGDAAYGAALAAAASIDGQ